MHVFLNFCTTYKQSINVQRMPGISNSFFEFTSPLFQIGHCGTKVLFIIVYKNITSPVLCYQRVVPISSVSKNEPGERCPQVRPYFTLFFMTAACPGRQWPQSRFLLIKKYTVFQSTPCKIIHILNRKMLGTKTIMWPRRGASKHWLAVDFELMGNTWYYVK